MPIEQAPIETATGFDPIQLLSHAISTSTPQSDLNRLLVVLEALPNNFTISTQGLDTALENDGLSNDPQLMAVLRGVTSVSKEGNQIELHRDQPTEIKYNEPLIDGAVSIDSLNMGSTSFNLDLSAQPQRIDNIKGLSLTVSAFGNSVAVPIEGASVAQDLAGNSVVTGYMENPLPAPARNIFAMTPTIPISLTLTKQGQILLPTVGSVLTSAANSNGNTLPGMVLKNYLDDAASVDAFANRYPVWMRDTVEPIVNRFSHGVAQYTGFTLAAAPESNKSVVSEAPKGSGSATTADSAEVAASPPAIDNLPPIPSHVTKGGRYSETVDIDGVERQYLMYVPPNYDPNKPLPLVMAIHGLGGNAADFEKQTGLDGEAAKEGFIVVYPQATRWLGSGGWTAWDTNNGIIPPGSHANDIQFLKTIIDNTQQEANIDPKRIYLTGISNGGMMTFDAVDALSDKIAAIAIVSGGMSGKEKSPTEPISILNMHGTADTVIPFGGVQGVPNVLTELGIPTFEPDNYIAQYWKKEDGITGPGQTIVSGNDITSTYTNPKDGAEVEQVTVVGGQHTPSHPEQVMNQVWQFLSAHPKITPTSSNKPPVIPPSYQDTVSPVQQVLNDVKERGVKGIESDADRVVSAMSALPNGSIDTAQMFDNIDDVIDKDISNPLISFIGNTNLMSKQGDFYSIDRSSNATVPLNYKIPGTGGIASLQGLQISKDTSFNLDTQNGLSQMRNINGLSVNLNLFGHGLSSNIQSLTEEKFKDGSRAYELKVSQPMPALVRTILMEPSSIDVKIKFDANGQPHVENQSQIEDDVIGYNPFVRGAVNEVQDVANLSHFGWGTAFNVGKDTAVTTGATIAGGVIGSFFGAPKLGATLGFLVAPGAVDAVDNL